MMAVPRHSAFNFSINRTALSAFGPSAMIAQSGAVTEAGKGTIHAYRNWLALTGADAKGAQAATVEFILRFWPNAKDATIRITGVEKGKALGNSAGGSTIDPP